MAVSSIKGCWYKFATRIRDFRDLVDSYYRPDDEVDSEHHITTASRSHSKCDRVPSAKDKHNNLSSHRHNHHHHHHPNCQHEHQRKFKTESTNSQLPPGFTKRKTSQGQVFFIDSNGHRYWHDPNVPADLLSASLNLDSLVGRLSSSWEMRQTQNGKIYYVNHTKKTTQFTDPRLVAHKDYLMRILKHAQCACFSNKNTTTTANSLSTANFCNHVRQTTGQKHASNTNSTTTNPKSSVKVPSRNVCSLHQPPNQRSSTLTQLTQNDVNNHSNRRSPMHPYSRRGTCQTSCHNEYTLPRNPLSESFHNPVVVGPMSTSVTASATIKNTNSNNTNTTTTTSNNLQESSTTVNSSTRANTQNYVGSNSNLFSLSANITPSDNQNMMRNNKELYDKISILRQELLKQQVIAHPCRIDIHRKKIFEESFRIISQMQPRDLKKRLLVKFRGEEGLDYGGVAREWFYLLSREILNPVHGLFQYTSDDIYNLQINPDSGIVYREHLSYLNFCGRVIGMAVFHGHFIEGHFTLPFYKMLLKKAISLDDIELVDPELHRSLCWILENDITNVIDTTFLVQHNAFGQLQEHELKENGRNTVVTEENKHEYVSLYVNYRCRRGIESQFEALQKGFYELISPSLVENFDEHELELLIGGLSKINIDDWRLHTKLKNCTVESPLVKWFWDIVKSYGEDKRARLLQFVTGSPRVPIQGFKALQGVNSELRLFTIHMIKNACTDNLPKSHTCFNRIDLPPYECYEKLRDKLTQAIEETMGFAMQ